MKSSTDQGSSDLTLTGYRRCAWRQAATVAMVAASGGVLGLVLYCTVLYRGALYCTVQVLYWWPHWRLRCTHAPCSLHTAHTVLATVTSNHCRSFPIYICF